MKLTSPAFASGTPIPAAYTQDGANLSPPLAWSDVPAGTRSFVLTCFDPDVPRLTWYHWALFNLPTGILALPEGISGSASILDAIEATNDFCRAGYDGPSPPPGHGRHRYCFRLLALDVPALPLSRHCCSASVEAAAEAHAIAEAELVGIYARESLRSPVPLPGRAFMPESSWAASPDF